MRQGGKREEGREKREERREKRNWMALWEQMGEASTRIAQGGSTMESSEPH